MSHQDTAVAQRPRRTLTITLGVVIGLVALYLGWVFIGQPLLTGDTTDDTDVVAAPPTDAATEVGTDGSAVPAQSPSTELADGGEPVVETYEVFLSRDPFKPVRPAPAPVNGGEAPVQPAPGDEQQEPSSGGQDPSDDQTPAGGDTDVGDGTDTTGALPPTGGDATTVDTREVTLVDVLHGDSEPQAVVEVNGTIHQVGVGQRFADNFQVLALDEPCATLLFGDDAFTLCEGERVLK